MRTSSICYINSKGVIQLHENVVEGLSIFDNSILYGIYYPRSKHEDESVFKEDFMFTPIPYRLWFKTARFIIKIEKQSLGIKKISRFLNEKNVSILQSNSTRSGHRYSIWDLHISYDDIEYDSNDYDESNSYFSSVFDRTKELKQLIIDKFSREEELLFSDKDNYFLTEPINAKVNTALHYFYQQTEENKISKGRKENKLLFTEFTLRYDSGTITTNTGKKLVNIIKLSKPESTKRLLPTIAFIEGESHFLSFRLRIIPRERLDNFFMLTIFHTRMDKEYKSTKGFFDYIVNNFGSNIKIWRFYNQLNECRDTFGSGKQNFIIEVKNQNIPMNLFRKELENTISDLNDQKPQELSHITFWSNTTPIYPNYIKHYFRNQREILKNKKYDVFISFSFKDFKYANIISEKLKQKGISVYIASEELRVGDDFHDVIREALLNSRELCLIYSENSKNSNYVNTEWGAAWFMKKTIATITMGFGEKEKKELEDRLKSKQFIDYKDDDEFEKYVDDIMRRRIEFLLEDDKNKYQ